MTLANGRHALRSTPSPPLTPAAAATHDTSPIAIDTSAFASTLLLLRQAEHDEHRPVWLRRRQSSTERRARSHSPSRRSPKLRHTNGRLHANANPGDRAEEDAEGDAPRRVDESDLTLAERETELLMLGGLGLADPVPSSVAVDLDTFPARSDVRRSISCADYRDTRPAHARANHNEHAPSISEVEPPARTLRRFKIFYRDEALRENCAKNTRRVLENAKRLHQQPTTSADPSAASACTEPLSNQQRVTLKLLKYRNLIERVHEIDESRLNDPSFDVLECLGVWCKV